MISRPQFSGRNLQKKNLGPTLSCQVNEMSTFLAWQRTFVGFQHVWMWSTDEKLAPKLMLPKLSPLNGVEGFGGFELGIHVPKKRHFSYLPRICFGGWRSWWGFPTMEIITFGGSKWWNQKFVGFSCDVFKMDMNLANPWALECCMLACSFLESMRYQKKMFQALNDTTHDVTSWNHFGASEMWDILVEETWRSRHKEWNFVFSKPTAKPCAEP